LAGGIVLEQRDLARQAQDRGTRLGRPGGLAADDQHPAELSLERLETLADRRGCDVEAPGRCFQGALVHDRRQRLGEVERYSHEAMLMRTEKPELGLCMAPA